LVGGQRVGLPAGAVEREHQPRVQPLPQGVGSGQRLQLPEDVGVPAGRQFQVDDLFARRQLQLGQPRRLRRGPARIGELRQRRAAPQRQALPVQPRSGRRIRAACPLYEMGEADGVDALRIDVEQIAGPAGDDQRSVDAGGTESAAQLGHPHLQRVGRVAREVLAPQCVDQRRDGDHPAGSQRQHRQHLPFPAPGQGPELPIDDHLDRAEDADLHAAPLPLGRCRDADSVPSRTARTTRSGPIPKRPVSEATASGQRATARSGLTNLHRRTP
jgi:hypothetical protein